jgi:glutamate/tyrosine decarboxylase-like PLP-dependent enzyme
MELLAPVPLSAVCFRYIPRGDGFKETHLDDLNLRILRDVQRSGRVYISNATIHGKFALRACMVNHRTTAADVEAVIDEVLRVGRELSTGAQF